MSVARIKLIEELKAVRSNFNQIKLAAICRELGIEEQPSTFTDEEAEAIRDRFHGRTAAPEPESPSGALGQIQAIVTQRVDGIQRVHQQIEAGRDRLAEEMARRTRESLSPEAFMSSYLKALKNYEQEEEVDTIEVSLASIFGEPEQLGGS